MSLLDRTESLPRHDDESLARHDDTIDLTRPDDDLAADHDLRHDDDRHDVDETPAAERSDRTADHRERRPARPRSGRRPVRGMRIRRVRIASVAKVASVFSILGYLSTMATLVVVWNVALHLGFVSSIEDGIASALGLPAYDVVGQALFNVLLVAFGVLALVGLLITVLLAIVYNASCMLFGGIAVETGPLRRGHRVFSLRHRRFVTVRR